MRLYNLFKKIGFSFCIFSVTFMHSGCTTVDPYTGQERLSKGSVGAGVGAIGGALAGQAIGRNTTATLIGAGLGAAIGEVTGSYMDNQDNELRAKLRGTGVQVIRDGGDIRLIMPGDITFENNSFDIRSRFYGTLDSVAIVLNKFSNTNVKVIGYASSTGNKMHNQELSEKRAHSVADYLVSRKVNSGRIMAVGYGARNPIADNATSSGQALNRRVEITIRHSGDY
jgi:outer membrane protein OmpA-like peptidoglycan-associated protein